MMKKLFAAATLAYALAIPAAGVAAADGHNVIDETVSWKCAVGTCVASGSAVGAEDIGQKRGQDFEPANNEGDLLPAVQSIDTSTPLLHNNLPPHKNLPVSSYPAPASWPGSGWGVDDTK